MIHADTPEGTLRWALEEWRGRMRSVVVLAVLEDPADGGDVYRLTRSTANAAEMAFLAHLLHREIDEMVDKAITEACDGE